MLPKGVYVPYILNMSPRPSMIYWTFPSEVHLPYDDKPFISSLFYISSLFVFNVFLHKITVFFPKNDPNIFYKRNTLNLFKLSIILLSSLWK